MRIRGEYLLDIAVIISFTLILGFLFGAWAYPYPPGLDTFAHLYKVKFILDYWPHIRWDYHWAAGVPLFRWYPPLSYPLMALIVKITCFPMELVLILLLASSYCLTGLGVYGLTHEITADRNVSLIASLLAVSTPYIWSLYLFGGMCCRVLSMFLLPLSLWSIVKFTKKLAKNEPTRKTFVGTVLLIATAISIHTFTGGPILLSFLPISLFCIKGWKQKVYAVIGVFASVLLLNAYFFVPFIFPLIPQYYGPHGGFNVSSLFRWPNSGSDSTLSPLTWPLTAIILAVTFYYKSMKREIKQNKYLIAFAFLSLSLAIFASSGQLLIIGASEALILLTFYLLPFDGILLSQTFNRMRKHHKLAPTLLSATLICVIVVSSVMIIDANPEGKITGRIVLSNFRIPNREIMYRAKVIVDWGGSWFNYRYDVPQTGHYYGLGTLNPDWDSWFQFVAGETENYNETNFLLEWWSVKWILSPDPKAISIPHEYSHQWENFLSKPEYYEFTAKIGDVYQFNFSATPIISATNTVTLLVLGGRWIDYNDVFRSLAFSDYDSRYVIPIRSCEYIDDHKLDELSRFDAILLYGYKYRDQAKAWRLLSEYVENGGGLIIETGYSPDINASHIPIPCPVDRTSKTDFGKEWHFSYVESSITKGIDFLSFSPAIYNSSGILYPWGVSASYNESVRSWAEPVLWDGGHPLVVTGEYGKGRVVWSGLNLIHHAMVYKNPLESSFIAKMIQWVTKDKGISDVSYTVDRPHPEEVTLTVDSEAKGVLFKESYFKNWYAHLTDANGQKHSLRIYEAGPGFMYVYIPNGVRFPIKVVFNYCWTWDEVVGYLISTMTLIALVMYAVGLPVDKPAKKMANKLEKQAKRVKEWWYRE